MRIDQNRSIHRLDYAPFGYHLQRVELVFDLDPVETQVQSQLYFCRDSSDTGPLVLMGQDIDLQEVWLNEHQLAPTDYRLDSESLTIWPQGETFRVKIRNRCRPEENTVLMGLYASGEHLFTQCEPQGFRRITWFPDRPDVLSVYRVTLRACQKRYPSLLSNGNLLSERTLPKGRHEAVWEDPHPKPSYLFALVAGRFDCREKTISTCRQRPVQLQIYSDIGTRDQTEWALECLERALRWDESTFGLELDLDRFMIVAARDFTMGAMENKGLNIFNAAYILASKDTATDSSYRTIEAVVGHEYFHNWTGNRVTCRDWFQLSLKEGLTVFREQSFSADMLSNGLSGPAAHSARAVKRIDDVTILRTQQFPEDASPMAHPIRPQSYQEISNFYTATIYEKGAEVIRMLHTLLGASGFRQGLLNYLQHHDGGAATCDDFIDAMEAVYKRQRPEHDLAAFRRWYEQAGTPRIKVTLDYDESNQQARLHLSQNNPAVGIERQSSPSEPKLPLHIPIAIGFLSANGDIIVPDNSEETTLLELRRRTQSWTFEGLKERPVLSLLRDFSAPVVIEYDRPLAELVLLARHDSNAFARWEATQALLVQEISYWRSQLDTNTRPPEAPSNGLLEVWQSLLHDPDLAADYRSRILRVPSSRQLVQQIVPSDPIGVSQSRQRLHAALGRIFTEEWLDLYQSYSNILHQPYDPNPQAAGKRALCALALNYLLASGHPKAVDFAHIHYKNANNLTDRLAALDGLTRYAPKSASDTLMSDFRERFARHSAQVMDHWFRLQASAHWATADTVRELMRDPDFSLRNPNRARSLIFEFCLNNLIGVHQPDGYAFWAEQIIALDALNPEVAARLARGLETWAHYVAPAKDNMQHTLRHLQRQGELSPNVQEIVNKALSI